MALVERLGPLGFKLHTGRSRNELVATDFRLFVKDAAREMARGVVGLAKALADLADRNMGVPMPGMTHLQHAQPLLLSHFLLAHAEAFRSRPRASGRRAARGRRLSAWAPARSAARHFPWTARRWRASWDLRASRPTAWTPSATAISRSTICMR